jgi:aspartate aminotransferase
VLCGSASKTYAMTGWRCGWAIGPAAVISASNALQSNSTSNVSSITQKAVTEALTGNQEPVRAMLAEYRERRDRLHEWLTADPRFKCHKPGGAFYMFVDVSEVVAAAGLKTTTAFAEALIEDARVALTPGEAFGAPGFVRISYATSMENLREGSRRMLEFARVRTTSGAAAGR